MSPLCIYYLTLHHLMSICLSLSTLDILITCNFVRFSRGGQETKIKSDKIAIAYQVILRTFVIYEFITN